VRGRGPQRAAWLLGAVVALGCRAERSEQASTPAAPTATAAAEARILPPDPVAVTRRAIAAWLECDECVDGELDAVLRIGSPAVPTLVATLEHGPSPAAREQLRRGLETRHAQLVEYAKSHPDSPVQVDADAWIAAELANYLARYQIRSAQALARLDGPEAKRALEAELSQPLRPDVERAVRDALASMPRS